MSSVATHFISNARICHFWLPLKSSAVSMRYAGRGGLSSYHFRADEENRLNNKADEVVDSSNETPDPLQHYHNDFFHNCLLPCSIFSGRLPLSPNKRVGD